MPVDLSGGPPYGLDALSRRLDEVLADLQRAADAGERTTIEDAALSDLESNFRKERYWLLSERRRRMADGRPFDDVNADILALNNKLAWLFSQSRRFHTRATNIRATLSGEHPNPFEEELNRLERAIEETFRPDELDQEKPWDLIEDCGMAGKAIELALEELSTRWDDATAELQAVRVAVKNKGAVHPDYRRLLSRVKELEHSTAEYYDQSGISNDLRSRYWYLESRIGEIWVREVPGDMTFELIQLSRRGEDLIEERSSRSRSSSAQIDAQLEAIIAEFDAEEREYTALRNEEFATGKDTSSADEFLAVIARERAIVRRALTPAPTSTQSTRHPIPLGGSEGHRPSSGIASFQSFAGFSLGDPASAVATRLGPPHETHIGPSLTHYSYGAGSVVVSVGDGQVFCVRVDGAEGVNWLRGHGIIDQRLELIGKTKSVVLASYGAPVSVNADNYTYEQDWGAVTFICYDHDGYICSEITVQWDYVESATAPVLERTELHREGNVVPQPVPGCPHCGFEGNASGAIRCFSCKTPLSSWLLSGRLPANNVEPSITATVCGYLVMIIGGLLATTYVFSALFVFQRPGRGTTFATLSGIAIGIAFALAIARAGLKVLKGEPNSRMGFYIALALLGLATGLATVTGYRTGSPGLTAAAGGILALLVLIAIAFSRDHARARN